MISVTLYTRANCPLCEKAKAAIRASGVPVVLTEVDIDRDEALRVRYTDDVPVIHVDGNEAFRHSVDPAAFAAYVKVLDGGWRVIDGYHLEKEFTFPDFAQALAFTNRVGAIAEEQGHHPDIHLSWGKARVTTWTHDTDGLTRSDFELAAKIQLVFGSQLSVVDEPGP
ncbi:MAG TPA: 4a-hydroxytetrahydrobiopterin dehydratase [Thermoanaerobaculia bacterium]|jgi:4a-hydroxytetrahydrobiopterin dehydratase|nr:4a-hydroxytetrahydrobiopterin dehydratase [Thermoanaerobaculia bacterium]